VCVDYILGPEEDLTGVVIDDEAGNELELALSKTRRLKQKKNRSALADRVLQAAANDSDSDEPQGDASAAIILNATSEFCRSLGDIPSYGMAGNRDEDEEGMVGGLGGREKGRETGVGVTVHIALCVREFSHREMVSGHQIPGYCF